MGENISVDIELIMEYERRWHSELRSEMIWWEGVDAGGDLDVGNSDEVAKRGHREVRTSRNNGLNKVRQCEENTTYNE